MIKRKRRVKKGRDRLSELPDSLIFHIFQFSETTEVVRTTLLSKRWKNLWTTLPWLDFNDNNKITTEKFRNLVGGAIKSWKGSKIIRFNVTFDYKLEKPLTRDIDSWMNFAIENKVEDLKLRLPYSSVATTSHVVPQFLSSCSSLKVLHLKNCGFQIHANVQWDQLKSLTIRYCNGFVSENGVNQVLCGCPKLEYFDLTFYDRKENLSIKSSSLKWLYIRKFLFHTSDAPSTDTELRIWAPNLQTLDFMGIPYSKCLLMNVSSLTKAYLDFDGPCRYWHQVFHGGDFVEETLKQILPKIKHVRSVILSDWCFKAVAAMKEKQIVSPFPNANFLELIVCSKEYDQVVGVVEMFPKLRDLVLENTCNNQQHYFHVQSHLKFDTNLPNLLLLPHLRTVDVTWSEGDDSIFPLIQILLKHARNLAKMVFRQKRNNKTRRSWKALFAASQKLLKMERSSPTAKLIFC